MEGKQLQAKKNSIKIADHTLFLSFQKLLRVRHPFFAISLATVTNLCKVVMGTPRNKAKVTF